MKANQKVEVSQVSQVVPASFESVQILVVGDVMLDRYWFGEVSRISPEAPVPIVRVEKREERLGGAANVARNIATLGGGAGLLGVVGQDEAGDVVDSLLTELGINSFLTRDPAISTIIKLRVIGRQQQLLRIDFEEPPTDTVLRDKLTRFNTLLPQYGVIVLSDYAKGSLVNVADMIAAAKDAGKCILVDPKGDDFSRYAGATILTPNKSELMRIVGTWKSEEELTTKAQNLRQSLALEALLVTRSEEGMTLYTDHQVVHFPTMAREVFDVSGAGDTVIATMAVMMGAGFPIAEAVALANRAGGIVVGKLGTATVTHKELFP
ncbi:D-glycero-beta-D-manno-heptose-7-phosphate kinase [Glaciimonas sp. CA11.2]|uniref:D-glycero-beta-D-manno-heptose-7-phosphate kinase n=1 Tax=unclassified Glaciimonas TaxID=2644401 RepID=UPI002AB3F286|nr:MULTISPECIES: D-glycero-beta-D-manno-heptose-7-phosphate kinase [unclassified Glaciimonas]MDY7546772.1 D-glycero-beta-D-manno-heptose-7-phosphate kinase [Glaciimonas sp. CA11.2]MEB0011874.1 D-glycero-beta-D-manno-heptose-7-phosphate kinase [Glaciimonas sp. Cout2]MEB0080570.1 D-glycero-beta-D-manno-heptose-7-phosphate kinase [Glaciimonas sp. Gout2]MEB0163845.1 D-glycero-beta-D-manno-heptose-7-phosphate kinase [Glaciimonas sp. CA11.2]